MGFFSWRRWLNRKSRSARRSPASRFRTSFRSLELETLEERLAPATDIWTGGPAGNANFKWSNPANWSNGVPNPGDDLVFPAGVPTASLTNNTNDLPAGTFINSITFSGSGYTLPGNQIILGTAAGGNTITANSSTMGNTIGFDIQLGATSGNHEFLTVNFGADLTLSGNITGTSVNLTKEGIGGTLILAHNNSNLSGPITVDQGILQITDAGALGDASSPTTVDPNAQLQVNNVAGAIPENLILNGPGPTNDGALLNVAGANTWAGSITLDSDASIGATAGTLNITGSIGDLGAGHSVTKEGAGTVIFSVANSYRGTTTINNGILDIRNGAALGDITSPTVATLVNSTLTGQGTLQIEDPTGVGFVVEPYKLTLNGLGFNNVGALDNLNGNNTWTGNVTLGSPKPNGSNVSIGAESQGAPLAPTNLLISGVIGDVAAGSGPFNLTKVGTGRIIFTNGGNSYLGTTTVAAGFLNVEDSQALGPQSKVNGTTVRNGAALELELQKDNIFGLVPSPMPDSITGTTNTLDFLVPLTIAGTGVNGTGALHSISGINVWNGTITLTSGLAAIGVDPDPNASNSNSYFPTYNGSGLPVSGDFSLTVVPNAGNGGAGVITGGGRFFLETLEKTDGGQLILPSANTYQGPTDIHQGWITIQNNQSLGAHVLGLSDTVQPYTTVEAGAALHLKTTVPGATLTVPNNLNLAGLGITHPFALMSQKGALMNLDGINTLTGSIQLNGVAGIGVEQVDTVPPPIQSDLTTIGEISDAPTAPAGGGGIVKLGSKRLDIQGDGTYTGIVDIREGVILDQNNSGLGLPGTATASVGAVTVESGAALELQASVASLNGGISTGLEVWGKQLILNGAGNTSLTGTLIQPLTNLTSDNMWRGSVSLAGSSTIDVEPDTRLTLYGPIDDASILSSSGADLTKVGAGELDLAGTSTYRGHTFVNEGIVVVQNGQALGVGPNPVVVANGASLEMQGNITVAGKPLQLQGAGVAATPNVPVQWFQQGPAPIQSYAPAPGSPSVSGRVTGIAVDPTDPNVIYISTAGGGAWKTLNSGQTWVPLFDSPNTMFSGAIAIAPSDPRVIYLGTGEANNSFDSFYGTGVYKSTDSGHTWTLLTDPSNPMAGKAVSKIVVDPNNANLIYVADSDRAVNGTSGPGVPVGVWRFDGTTWFNLTSVVSFNRKNNKGSQAAPPNTPGPDDDYRIVFPQIQASWTDIALDRYGVLFAALGRSDIASGTSNQADNSDGVFRCENPQSNAPVWFMGNGDQPGVSPDSEASTEFPTGVTSAANGNIKLAVATPGPFSPPVSSNTVIYAAITDPTSGSVLKIEQSTDGGVTWGVFGGPGDYMGGQGAYASAIVAISPTSIVVGGHTNSAAGQLNEFTGAAAWAQITTDSSGKGPHDLTHALAIDSQGRILAGTDGGIWRLSTSGGTNTWQNLNGNLAISLVNGISLDPSNPSSAFVTTRENGAEMFSGPAAGAASNPGWTFVDAVGGTNGGAIKIDQRNTNIIYDVESGVLDKSSNGGVVGSFSTISTLPARGTTYFPLVLDSVNDQRLLVGGLDLQESLNAGGSWINLNMPAPRANIRPFPIGATESGTTVTITTTAAHGFKVGATVTISGVGAGYDGTFTITSVPTPTTFTYEDQVIPLGPAGGGTASADITAIGIATNQGPFAVDPGFPLVTDQLANTYDPNTIYAVANNQVFVTKNQGLSWLNRSTGLSGNLVDIEVDPRDRDTVYVVVGGFGPSKVFMTNNAGRSWIDITGPAPSSLPDLPTHKLVIDPRNGNLYVGNDNGVWLSTDGGTSWNRFGAGLPEVQVTDMALNPALNTLAIATYGRSTYQIWLDDSQADAGALNSVSGSGVWTGPVTLTGDTVIGARGTQAIQDGISTATLNIVGSIGDNTAGGTSRLTKIGLGDVTLSGANTYGGVTEVQEGALIVHNPLALGGTANGTIVDAGAALELQSSVIAEPLFLSGDGIAFNGHNTGALRNVSNNNVYAGPITLETNTTIGVDSGSTLVISGSIGKDVNIQSALGFTKELTGLLVLTSANTYDGPTDINQGAIQAQNGLALGPAGSTVQVRDGAQLQLQTPTVQTIAVSGPTSGTFTLTFNGQTTGSLAVNVPASGGVGPTASMQNALNALSSIGGSGGSVTVTQSSNVYTVTFGGLLAGVTQPALIATPTTGTTVTINIVLGPPVVVSGKTLSLTGTGIVGTGALLNTVGSNTWNGPITLTAIPGFAPTTTPAANVAFGVANAADVLTVNGSIAEQANDGINDFGLNKVGPGKLVLKQSATYTGTTNVLTGILNIEDSLAVGNAPTSQTTVANGAVLELQANLADNHVDSITGTTNIAPPGALILNGTGIAGVGALHNLAGGNTWSGTVLLNITSSINVDPATQLNISGAVGGAATANLMKIGTGTLILSAPNGYLGQTLIQVGSLEVQGQGSLGAAGGALALVSPGATLQLQNLTAAVPTTKTIQLNGTGFNSQGALENVAGSNTVSGPVVLLTDSSIAVDQSTDTLSLSGVISGGSHALTKTGIGALAFTGSASNTYTGMTSVNDGALLLNKSAGAVAVAGNLTVGDGTGASPDVVQLIQGSQLLPAAMVTVNSDGLLDLNNQAQTIAGLAMTGGTINLAQPGSLLTLTGNVTASSDSAGNAAQINGPLNNGGRLILAPSTGTTTFFTENPGGGLTDLQISALVTAGAGVGLTAGPAPSSPAGSGTGTLALSNKETYPGLTQVSGGTLDVDAPGQVGAVSLAGGTIGGTGLVGTVTSTNVTGSGVHAGDVASPGTLSSADVTLDAKTTFNVTLGGTAPGVGFSELVVNGNINLAGAKLNVVLANNFNPTAGVDSFTIIQAIGSGHTVSNQFAQGTQAVINGIDYSITYTATTVVLQRLVVGTTTSVASSVNPSVFGQIVIFTATVNPTVSGVTPPIGGKVDFLIDGITVASNVVLDANDQARFSTASLASPLNVANSPHSVRVNFTDTDQDFTNSFGVLTGGQVVNRAVTRTTVTADINPSTYGQTVTYTAAVATLSPGTGIPAGTVDFVIDGTTVASGVAVNGSGLATFATSSLSNPLTVAGSPHSVLVNFHDTDGNHANSSGPLAGGQTVTKASTTITVGSTNLNAVYGEPVITATVAPQFSGTPTGTVTFTISGGVGTETDTLVGGVATLQKVLAVGTYVITATYSGDSNFLKNLASNQISQTINPANTGTTISSSTAGNTSVYGQAVTFTATVAPQSPGKGVPDGTVTWFVDSQQQVPDVTLVSGKATFTTSALTVNGGSPHSITATYHPGTSGNFLTSSGSLSPGQTVTPAPTSTTVTTSQNPTVFGQAVTFTASMVATPNTFAPDGTVTFFIDSVQQIPDSNVVNGQATFTISTLTVNGSGGHTVSATYNPNVLTGNFTGSSGSLSPNQVVNQDGTTTTVSSSSSTSTYGQQVTFKATVSANSPGSGTATGTVKFYLDSVTASNFLGSNPLNQSTTSDQATYTTTATQLPGGSHTIIAVYQGDSSFITSQGSTSQTVQRANSSTTDVASNNPSAAYGQAITLSATVSATVPGIGVPTGTINFYDGPVNASDLIGSSTVDGTGKAFLTVPSNSPVRPALSVASHTLTAVYQGDTNFLSSTSPAPQTVQVVTQAQTSTTLVSDTLPSAVYGQETIKATVADITVNSTGTPTGNVVFTIKVGSTTLPSQTIALVNGVATLTSPSTPASVLTELTAGGANGTTYTISAVYQGDSNFQTSSSGTVSQAVTQAQSATQLSASPNTNQSVAGQQVTFTAVVTPTAPAAGFPTGTVSFYDGPVSPANLIGTQSLSVVGNQAQASINDSSLAVSSTAHPVSAVYQGDNNFTTSPSNTVNFTVSQAPTTTTVSSSLPTSTYGQAVTFTATVSVNTPGTGTPTGNVNFYDGTVDSAHLLGSGTLNQNTTSDQAVFTTSATQLTGGNHTIIAVYQGDSNFLGTNPGSTSQTVQKVNTTTAILFTAPTPSVGHVYNITAAVTPAVSGLAITGGTVTFTLDANPPSAPVAVNSAGQAVFTVTFTTAGNHTIQASYSGDVNFVGSVATPLSLNVLTHNGGFVAQVYRDLLHREADPGGLASWASALDQGLITRTQLVFALESSTEYRSNVVDALYVHYLHRHADPGGLSAYVNAMAHGFTDEQIAASLAGSDEYFINRGGSTADGFITALYLDALNRQPDPQGRQAFEQALSFHVSRLQVATSVLGSFEYKSDLVFGYYSSFLHRSPDPNGQNAWATAMTQGLTDEQVIAAIIGSPEYFNNV
jgi:autotransporter-associated beta strand protein